MSNKCHNCNGLELYYLKELVRAVENVLPENIIGYMEGKEVLHNNVTTRVKDILKCRKLIKRIRKEIFKEGAKTNKEAYEDAAGMNIEPLFFRMFGIDPDAIYTPQETYCSN